jgi:hypothetical protein
MNPDVRAALGHGLCRMGAGRSARQIGHARDHRSRSRERRAVGAQPYNTEFAGRVAFFDVDEPKRSVSGDRTEFLGRNGTPGNPAALRRVRLSGRVGAGLDPCAAIQVGIDLPDGQQREIVFRLGVGRDAGEALGLVQRFRGSFGGARGARGVCATVEPHLGRGAGGNARSVGRRTGQRLAAIPDTCLPHLGAQRLLPVGRRLRLP